MSVSTHDPLVEVIGQRVLTPEDGEGIVTRVGAGTGPVTSVIVMLDRPVNNGGELLWDLQYPPAELEPV